MSKNNFISVPITFVFKDGLKVYDYKAMIDYFENRIKKGKSYSKDKYDTYLKR